MSKKTKEAKSVEMDEKSANPGDRMKHALSLEVLYRTADWPTVCYSETHAGAGVYQESKQKPVNAHIRTLRERTLWELLRPTFEPNLAAAPASSPAPGATYLELLKHWWASTDRFGSYPGSAKQAVEYLVWQKRSFQFLLTEYDLPTFRKLKDAVKGYPGEVLNESFEAKLDRLTEPDHLYLVVDPFRCVAQFKHEGLSDEKFAVTKGDIDHGIVKRILERCTNKTAVVIQFWWPTTTQDKEVRHIITISHKQTRFLFRRWKSEAEDRCYRHFDDKHNHASALLGQGKGADIVRQIGELAWEKSWMSPFLRLTSEKSEEEHA